MPNSCTWIYWNLHLIRANTSALNLTGWILLIYVPLSKKTTKQIYVHLLNVTSSRSFNQLPIHNTLFTRPASQHLIFLLTKEATRHLRLLNLQDRKQKHRSFCLSIWEKKQKACSSEPVDYNVTMSTHTKTGNDTTTSVAPEWLRYYMCTNLKWFEAMRSRSPAPVTYLTPCFKHRLLQLTGTISHLKVW